MGPAEIFKLQTEDEAVEELITFIDNILTKRNDLVRYGEFVTINIDLSVHRSAEVKGIKDRIIEHYVEAGWDNATISYADDEPDSNLLTLVYKNE